MIRICEKLPEGVVISESQEKAINARRKGRKKYRYAEIMVLGNKYYLPLTKNTWELLQMDMIAPNLARTSDANFYDLSLDYTIEGALLEIILELLIQVRDNVLAEMHQKMLDEMHQRIDEVLIPRFSNALQKEAAKLIPDKTGDGGSGL